MKRTLVTLWFPALCVLSLAVGLGIPFGTWLYLRRQPQEAHATAATTPGLTRASARPQWVTVALFDGQSTKGWVEKAGTWGGTSGRWQAKSGSLCGFRETADIPTLTFGETLPCEFDLNLSVCNNADEGSVGILLSDDTRRRQYVFWCSWGFRWVEGSSGTGGTIRFVNNVTIFQNLSFGMNYDPRQNPPDRFFDAPQLSFSLGKVYRLTWVMRAAGIDFAIDGEPVTRIPDTVPSTSVWRLTLQDDHPIGHVESGRRHRVLPPEPLSPDFEVVEEEHGAVFRPGAAPPEFSAIEVTVPAEQAKRIRRSVKS